MADSLLAEETRLQFETQRYVALRSLIEDGLAAMIYGHIQRRVAAGNIPEAGGPSLGGSLEDFADPLMEYVLKGVQPRVEEFCGLKLYPTYSFFRLYRRGGTLHHHRDRPSCEISVSVNLGPKLERPWPLWITGPRGTQAIELAPGDGLLYRGIECEHWRERFDGEELAQVFLHYVDQNGPYSDYRFDQRPALGLGPHTRARRTHQPVNLATSTPQAEPQTLGMSDETQASDLARNLDMNTSEHHLGGYIPAKAEPTPAVLRREHGDPATWTPKLWRWAYETFGVRSVLDVGCGEGHCVGFFHKMGCDVAGIDGSLEAFRSSVIPDVHIVHDYVDGPYTPDRRFDLVWSCEFVEHVEERYCPNFLTTFDKAEPRFLMLTHAIPGQPGWHHVNCQPASYWVAKMLTCGFALDRDLTRQARTACEPGHFRMRGLVFTRESS